MSKAIPHDHVLTPFGLLHKDFVKEVTPDDRSTLEPRPDFPKGPPPHVMGLGGWIEAGTFTPSEPLGSMRVSFKVPEPPKVPGALIYLFPGAQNASLTTLLQPVLQWGNNNKFGGEYWTIASWHYVAAGGTRHSHHVRVNPHDTVVGTIKVIAHTPDACDWSVEARLGESDTCATLIVPGLTQLLLFLAAGALEAYSLESLGQPVWGQYPESGSTRFHIDELQNLNGTASFADWNSRIRTTECGFEVRVSDNRKDVTLVYP